MQEMFLFLQYSNLLWDMLILLSNEYQRLFPGSKATGA
jgi:hypothetical protein